MKSVYVSLAGVLIPYWSVPMPKGVGYGKKKKKKRKTRKKAPKGYHFMKGGRLMKDSAHKKRKRKK